MTMSCECCFISTSKASAYIKRVCPISVFNLPSTALAQLLWQEARTHGILATLFGFGQHFFIRLYTTDEAVIAAALIRMSHVVILEWMPSSYEISGSVLRGMGRSVLPAIITILGTFVFRILWVFTVFARFHDFGVLMTVYPVSWVLTGTVMIAAYYIICRKLFRVSR